LRKKLSLLTWVYLEAEPGDVAGRGGVETGVSMRRRLVEEALDGVGACGRVGGRHAHRVEEFQHGQFHVVAPMPPLDDLQRADRFSDPAP